MDCEVCETIKRDGWIGSNDISHCRTCHKVWPRRSERQHCTVCHETFKSNRAASRHWTIEGHVFPEEIDSLSYDHVHEYWTVKLTDVQIAWMESFHERS